MPAPRSKLGNVLLLLSRLIPSDSAILRSDSSFMFLLSFPFSVLNISISDSLTKLESLFA